jgi:integrase
MDLETWFGLRLPFWWWLAQLALCWAIIGIVYLVRYVRKWGWTYMTKADRRWIENTERNSRKGISLNMVQKWLGHSALTTTAIYANAVGEEEQEIASRMWA